LRKICAIAASILAGLYGTSAETNGDDLDFELTPFGAYRFGGSFYVTDSDETLELDDASSYGVLFNVRQHHNTQWEILYSRQQTESRPRNAPPSSAAVDLDIQILQGGGTYQGEGERARPYVAATLGGTHIKSNSAGSTSDTFFSFSIGGGLQLRPNDRLGIRLEARAYGTLTASNTDLFCRTGPDLNVCAIRVDGKVLWQVETLAGIVFRF
jgi:opacity protein-like surface antigen